MVEVINGETGEVTEFEKLSEAAASMIERPPYRRRAMHLDDGEWGREYNFAFLDAQKKIGPTIGLDAQNAFNQSRYVSLRQLLAKVQPVLNDSGFIVNFGTGKVNYRSEAKQQFFLPVFLTLTHAETGQWKCVGHEIPILKLDPQSFGGTITYGRRYVLTSHLSIAGAEPDDDGVQASHELTVEQLDEMTAAMLDAIAQCKTEKELRAWYTQNSQQLGLIGAKREQELKEFWQNSLKDVKVRKGKTNSNE